MLAVNVTGRPNTAGFALDDTAVVVPARLTICVIAALLDAHVLRQLYDAVITWLIAGRGPVLKLAWPEGPRAIGPASTVAPSANITLPSVTGEPFDVTIAVRVADCPNTDGFTVEISDVVVGWSGTPVNRNTVPDGSAPTPAAFKYQVDGPVELRCAPIVAEPPGGHWLIGTSSRAIASE